MKHGSLFSGIGGFDLAAQWMGWDNIFHCEWNPFGQKVLKYYWPEAISYEDITKTDFTIHRGKIDILTGGFPCQPYSVAGMRKGKEDERHLWPEMLRAIREIKPRWVVGENVLGLVGWNDGMVFEEVQADLEAEGYEVQPYVLPAASVGAPHRRDRVWFVAYAGDNGSYGSENGQGMESGDDGDSTRENETKQFEGCSVSCGSFTPNANNTGIQRRSESGGTEEIRTNSNEQFRGHSKPADWSMFPTQPPVCSGNDGISSILDGITFPKWRDESIKAGGNAIVPQVAHQIFKAIQEYENLTPTL